MKKQMTKNKLNPILEAVRKKGRNGDTILAHINPLEAMMLKKAGGSGTINPKTGLPEFGGGFFSKNYWKKGAWKRDAATAAGVVVGNMILPGIGGIAGGALGGAAGTKIRGRKDYAPAMIKGAIAGATLPTAASIASSGANALGARSLGTSLSSYGTTNAILPSIGLGAKTSAALEGAGGTNAILTAMNASGGSRGRNSSNTDLENYQDYLKENGVGGGTEELSYFDKLKNNSSNFMSKPKNLLALGSAGLSMYDRMNQPKPLTAAQKGRMAKEEMLAARLTAQELAEQEQYELALEQSRRRNSRKKFLPEEKIDIAPLYNRVSSPEEYAQTGKWMNYYNNPQFTGQPVRF